MHNVRHTEMRVSLVAGLLLTVIASCSSPPPTWHDLPLPPDTSTIEEGNDRVFGWGPTLELDTVGVRSPDQIHEFYEETLEEQWELCPFSGSDWKTLPSAVPGSRTQFWSNVEQRRHFSVTTHKPSSDDSYAIIFLALYEGSETWDLVHRGYCESVSRHLFHPLAVIKERLYCFDDSTTTFESDAWKNTAPGERGQMLSDLLCRGLLLGLSMEQVLSLLGQPDVQSGPRFVYHLRKLGGYGRYKIPDTEDCKQEWFDLVFDYACDTLEECHLPYSVNPRC